VKPDGSLPCSQQPTTSPYPEPDESNSHTANLSLKINFNIILPSTPRSSRWLLSFRLLNQYFVRISRVSYMTYELWTAESGTVLPPVWYCYFIVNATDVRHKKCRCEGLRRKMQTCGSWKRATTRSLPETVEWNYDCEAMPLRRDQVGPTPAHLRNLPNTTPRFTSNNAAASPSTNMKPTKFICRLSFVHTITYLTFKNVTWIETSG
jgi:hypothetical protein